MFEILLWRCILLRKSVQKDKPYKTVRKYYIKEYNLNRRANLKI